MQTSKKQLVIRQEFKIDKQIYQNLNCQVYKGKNIKNGNLCTIKIQQIHPNHIINRLINQAIVLEILLSDKTVIDKGFPKLYYKGEHQGTYIVVQQYLGSSLETLFQQQGGIFTLKTTLMIADQIVKRLQFLHNKQFIHTDIKPNCFFIGHENSHKIYLCEFGETRKYQQNNQHIPYMEEILAGTLRYASLNLHMGIHPTRRDDFQSLCYCIGYFLKGHLPWQNLKCKTKSQKLEKIMQKKLEYRPQLLFKQFPKQLIQFFSSIRQLNYQDKPDYQKLKNLIRQCFINNNIQYDFYFDWDQTSNQKNKFDKKNI